jgi:hypothetical protein
MRGFILPINKIIYRNKRLNLHKKLNNYLNILLFYLKKAHHRICDGPIGRNILIENL